ncbi:MAG: hypothetical protein AVDCRST_MAG79-2635, partial [uncultured Thermoleophilia bacterium]
ALVRCGRDGRPADPATGGRGRGTPPGRR